MILAAVMLGVASTIGWAVTAWGMRAEAGGWPDDRPPSADEQRAMDRLATGRLRTCQAGVAVAVVLLAIGLALR